jgi:ribosomal protein S18 acetylase RimI-like enzyme
MASDVGHMRIRAFEDSDTETVVDLWKRCELVVPWNDPYKDIRRKMKVDPELFLVGEVDGAVIATAMAGYEGHRGWINYLCVAPPYQGAGRGRALVEEVERRLRERGCPKINLQIRHTNTGTAAFYEALGYGREQSIVLGKRLEHDDRQN